MKSHRLNINPGGMVLCADLQKTNISTGDRNRLLTVKEAEDLGLIARLALGDRVPCMTCAKCKEKQRRRDKKEIAIVNKK